MIQARRARGVALGGALVTICALAFNASPLLVPGVAFVAIGVITPLLVFVMARRARLHRVLGSHQVLEDERFTITVLVRAGRLGLAGAAVQDPIGSEPVPITLAPSLRGRTAQVRLEASFPRRGQKRLPPPALRVADPLSIAPALRRGTEHDELLVLPRTEPVVWRPRGGRIHQSPESGPLADALAASEVDGLRPYRPGTPASRIHWPAVARGAGLLERRMRVEQLSRPLVVLDSRCPPERLELLDAAVRAAASLVLELAKRGGCTLICGGAGRPQEVDPRLGGWPAAHMLLALVEPQHKPPLLSGRRPTGGVYYVAAQRLTRLPAALQMAAGTVLVMPAEFAGPEGWSTVFEVAHCTGYAAGGRARRARAPQTPAAGAPA